MHIFNVLANIASIVGLLFSFGALIQAWRASSAAREARDAILIRTLADEFELICARMDQLLDFIEHDRFPEAGIRAHEVASALSEIPFRRGGYLDEERRNQLLNAREQVQIMGQEVSSKRQRPLTNTQKEKLVDACRRTAMSLRENLGIIKSKIDSGVAP